MRGCGRRRLEGKGGRAVGDFPLARRAFAILCCHTNSLLPCLQSRAPCQSESPGRSERVLPGRAREDASQGRKRWKGAKVRVTGVSIQQHEERRQILQ